jgi:hypothetical protein
MVHDVVGRAFVSRAIKLLFWKGPRVVDQMSDYEYQPCEMVSAARGYLQEYGTTTKLCVQCEKGK